jgi:hypothetical protein
LATPDAGSLVVASSPVAIPPASATPDAGTTVVMDPAPVVPPPALPPTSSGTPDAGPAAVADAGAPAPVSGGGAFVGGFIESSTSTQVRPRLSAAELQALLPAAGGKFVFPAPYGTEAVRLTDANDCGGGDCVRYIGYSYWRNMNNHVGQSTMLVLVGLDQGVGGAGLSMIRYHKDNDQVDMLGPIFAGTSINANLTGEGIYFSGTRPSVVYVAQGAQLLRFDVLTKTSEVVFDAASTYGANTYLWQHHSSDDDVVHSATLRDNDTGNMLGCLVYREDTSAFHFFAAVGEFDECQIDRSGDWLVIKDNIDAKNGEDNRIINTKTWAETDLLDENGAAGHSDLGFGVLVAEDNWNQLPGAVRSWNLGQSPLVGTIVYHDPVWRTEGSSHISHTNARAGVALDKQVVCDSTSSRNAVTRGAEIFCYRLDGSLDVMVVAPVMTDLDAPGGRDDYAKAPKGNLDVTGRYFIWTSNTGGDRLDAFIVKVPALLGGN